MPAAYLDSCIVIYAVEKHPTHELRIRHELRTRRDWNVAISPLVRLETLVRPRREQNSLLIGLYESFFAGCLMLPVTSAVFEHALDLRVRHQLRVPDALHLATALQHGCDEFWTNDLRLAVAARRSGITLFDITA